MRAFPSPRAFLAFARLAAEATGFTDAPPVDRARAHVVLGRLDVDAADFALAEREFDTAAELADGYAPLATPTRAEALLQRGQARMQSGADADAKRDFETALALAPGSATAAHANFFLGVLALAADDRPEARKRFDALTNYPELATAAQQLLH